MHYTPSTNEYLDLKVISFSGETGYISSSRYQFNKGYVNPLIWPSIASGWQLVLL